ncbi:pilus assembly protein PilP [Candidatus Electronema sp. TJ]|uniref:pilus assembly protein PilP n=1 Tax=Candidatus Electronema sp. TJ TaxID=3401573 RepID=UPI003AA94D81
MHFSPKTYLLLTAVLLTAGAAAAQDQLLDDAPAVLDGAGKGRGKLKFEYQLDNRPDPFYPFISKEKKAVKDEEDKIIDPDEGEVLTGLRLLEPGQLKLVAVMSTPSGPMAMAEDVTGKGYLLREGMLIGKRGEIIEIDKGRVSIKETSKTQSGRILEKDVVMTLKKDDEQKGM